MKKVLGGDLQKQPMFREEEDGFVLIEAEKLSERDNFMRYKPRTLDELMTMEFIERAIRQNVKNFYCPRYSPSFATEQHHGICFVPGKNPAVGKDYYWWIVAAKTYKPERNSRLGTRLEYFAFLGDFIKRLVAHGESVSWAWHAVCNDSYELGHYQNDSDCTKLQLEFTGSRPVCGFCDLANTSKILSEDDCWLAGGSYREPSFLKPLASTTLFLHTSRVLEDSTGWVIYS